MDINLLQYGIAGLSIGALLYVIKTFLSHLRKRDEFLDSLISNHFKAHTEALTELTKSIDNLSSKCRL